MDSVEVHVCKNLVKVNSFLVRLIIEDFFPGRDRFPTPMPAELMRVWTRRGVFDTETPEMFGSEYTTSGPHPVDGSIHPRLGPNTRKYRRNTVTPTRMSVAHPIDGSVHPLPLTQVCCRDFAALCHDTKINIFAKSLSI